MKRIVSMFLAMIMLCAVCVAPAGAEENTVTGQAAADALYEMGLFKGTGTNANGTPIYALDKTPTRAQAVIMLVRLLGKETAALDGNYSSGFSDLSATTRPYINYAYANGLTSGKTATYFGAAEPVTEAQYLTFVLRALGYSTPADFQVSTAQDFASSVGLTAKYHAASSGFTRGDVAAISYLALSTNLKGQDTALFDKLNESGFGTIIEAPGMPHRLVEPKYFEKDGKYYEGLHIEGGIRTMEYNGRVITCVIPREVLNILHGILNADAVVPSEDSSAFGCFDPDYNDRRDGEWIVYDFGTYQYAYTTAQRPIPGTIDLDTYHPLRYSYNSNTVILDFNLGENRTVHFDNDILCYYDKDIMGSPYYDINAMLEKLGIDATVSMKEVSGVGIVWSAS